MFQFSIDCPKYSCTECLRRLRESAEFLITLRSLDAFWRQKTVCEAYRNDSEPENNLSDSEGSDISIKDDFDVTLENVALSSSHSHKSSYACAHCGYSFGAK